MCLGKNKRKIMHTERNFRKTKKDQNHGRC